LDSVCIHCLLLVPSNAGCLFPFLETLLSTTALDQIPSDTTFDICIYQPHHEL